MLEMICKNWKPCTLLVEMQKGAIPWETMGGSWVVQPSHFWVFIQKNCNQNLEEIALYVHCSFTPNSQNVQATEMCIDRWADKENMVPTYNRILFNIKGHSVTHNSMDEPWGSLKWATHRKINAARFYLYKVSKIAKFIELKCKMVVVRGYR